MGTINPTGLLFFDAYDKPLSQTGQPQPLCYRVFYLTGTTTPATVYQDGFLNTPYASNTITADSNGRFSPIYLDPNVVYRVQLYNAANQLLEDVDPISPAGNNQVVTGSFTITASGFSVGYSGVTAEYVIVGGRIVYLLLPEGDGTSNATTFTFTGLPAAIIPAAGANSMSLPLAVLDASGGNIGVAFVIANSGTIQLGLGASGNVNGWTASGTKGLQAAAVLVYFLY